MQPESEGGCVGGWLVPESGVGQGVCACVRVCEQLQLSLARVSLFPVDPVLTQLV